MLFRSRLAYTLCAGSIALLAELGLGRSGNTLALDVPSGSSLFVGETVQRRLDAVARSLSLNPVIRHRETNVGPEHNAAGDRGLV